MKNVCFHLNRKFWVTMTMLLAFTLPALAQKITVHGHVVDETGEELIGASVMEKGTTNGVSTDFDGNFELSVNPNATLVISYVGCDTQDVAVNGQTNLHVVMTSNATALDDVVVIGYGSVKKSDATGSVDLIQPSEIEAGISTSAQDLLTGASSGVVVTANGGNPNGSGTIRIRGGASLNASNDPLIVLDGVPLTNDAFGAMNPLGMISPDNIESMTILKDASATAIYGSRASNGVIIINTKKGKSGRPQVNFSASVTANTPRKTMKMLNASQFSEKIINYWGADSEAASAIGTADTDWQKEILRTSVSQDYNLSVGGTVGFLPYRVAGSYTNNQGIMKNSYMERVTAGVNLNPKFFNGLLQINANVKGYYVRQRDANAIGGAIDADPTRPVHDWSESGNPLYPYFYNGWSTSTTGGHDFNTQGTVNPVAEVMDPENIYSMWRSNGNLQIDYAFHFLPELHANLNLGYDVTKGEQNNRVGANTPTAWNNLRKDGAGYHFFKHELRRNTLLEFYLNYKKEVESIYSMFDIMAGYSWQREDDHGWQNENEFLTPGFLSPSQTGNILTYNPETESKVGTTYNPLYSWNTGRLMLMSFYGRINYSFKDTYLLTFTLRDDGTSRFAKDNRWGLFPALALAWKINNMPFMEGWADNMNEFKLRLGWGVTGQQAVAGYFDYMPVYTQSTQGSFYPNIWTGVNGPVYGYTLYPNVYNPNLKWEQTTTWNVGLDMGWWNNRLNVALDWYLRESKDLLAQVTVAPGAATSNEMIQNIGTLRNLGLEATISAKPVMTEDFTWNTAFNVAWNQNKITKLNTSNDPNYFVPKGGMGATGNTCQAFKVDYPAYTFALYEQVYDEQGLPIEGCYVDQNGDGQISSADLVFKHHVDPTVTMSWNNNFSYKGWDLGIQLRASIGNYVYNNIRAKRSFMSNTYTNSTLRNLVESEVYFNNSQYYSDYWLENAGFVRCDNITLGYTFSDLFNNGIGSLRLYGAVQNPFVITRYKGIDPEVPGGVDSDVYPRPVSFTFGVVATF